MKRKFGLIILGVLVASIGVGYLGNALGWWSGFTVLFKGWWTLFLWIPAVILMLNYGLKWYNILLFAAGILLLGAQYSPIVYKLILPILLILTGLLILFSSKFFKSRMVRIAGTNESYRIPLYPAFLTVRTDKHPFEFIGGEIRTFGSSHVVDLSGATLKKDALLDAFPAFSSLSIIPPSGVRLKVKAVPIFSRVHLEEDPETEYPSNAPTLQLHTVPIFSRVTVKERKPASGK